MYPTKLGTFPPRIDLGVQSTAFVRRGLTVHERHHHIAEIVHPGTLPELLGELRDAVYGDVDPEDAPASTHRHYLAAVQAALSNALWNVA